MLCFLGKDCHFGAEVIFVNCRFLKHQLQCNRLLALEHLPSSQFALPEFKSYSLESIRIRVERLRNHESNQNITVQASATSFYHLNKDCVAIAYGQLFSR